MIFCWTKSPSSVEILWSHYFHRILFPKKLLKGNCSLCFFEFFSSHHAKGYRALRGNRWSFRILRKNYSMLSRVTFTSVKFFLQLKGPRQFIKTFFSVAGNRLHAGLNKREWSKTWEMIFQTWRFFFHSFLRNRWHCTQKYIYIYIFIFHIIYFQSNRIYTSLYLNIRLSGE